MTQIKVVVSRINGDQFYTVSSASELENLISSLDLAKDFKFYIDGILIDDVDLDSLFDGNTSHIRITDNPQGVGALIGLAIAALATVATIFLAKPKVPQIPDAIRQEKESPNNRLTRQTNVTRAFQARPESFGLVRAYPDLINQSIYQYFAGQKKITEWFNIGLGHYDVSQIRYAESEFATTTGANSLIYQPNELIPQVEEGFEFPDVDNFELRGENEVGTGQGTGNVVGSSGAFNGDSSFVVLPNNAQTAFLLSLTVDVIIAVSMEFYYRSGPTGIIERRKRFVGECYFINATIQGPNLRVNFRSAILSTAPYTTLSSSPVSISIGLPRTAGPYVTPIPCTQIWLNFNARISGAETATAQITVQEIDEDNINVGLPRTANVTLRGKADIADTYFLTYKFLLNSTPNRFKVSVARTNNSNSNNVLVLEEMFAIHTQRNVRYPLDTIMRVDVTALASSSALQRRYNALINQKVIYWDPNGNRIQGYDPNLPDLYNPSQLKASRSFADAILHTWLVRARMPLDTIDYRNLYDVYDKLKSISIAKFGDDSLTYFDYTFDDADTSLGDRVQTICNCVNVSAYLDAGILRFNLNQSQYVPSALFNANNTILSGFKASYNMTLPNGYNGIELKFVNPKTNKFDFINYRIIDGSVIKGISSKPQKIDLVGCRNQTQADYRALIECRRLLHVRRNIQIKCFDDADTLAVGALVSYCDILDEDYRTGYVKSVNNLTYTMSEECTGNFNILMLSKKDGATESANVTSINGNKVTIDRQIPVVLFDGVNVQSASRFILSNSAKSKSTDYILREKKSNGDGTYNLTLEQYYDIY